MEEDNRECIVIDPNAIPWLLPLGSFRISSRKASEVEEVI
jgi:hypothetical protein